MEGGRLGIASARIEYGPLCSVFRVDLAALAGDIDRSIEGVLWEREAFLSISGAVRGWQQRVLL
jgi:hypothetical protein